jgi:hypothetical protein
LTSKRKTVVLWVLTTISAYLFVNFLDAIGRTKILVEGASGFSQILQTLGSFQIPFCTLSEGCVYLSILPFEILGLLLTGAFFVFGAYKIIQSLTDDTKEKEEQLKMISVAVREAVKEAMKELRKEDEKRRTQGN